MIPLIEAIIAFLFGICIGSFLNACIYRLPRGKSLVNPRRSFCPDCGSPIKAYDNIPLLSYLLLSGKCRDCHTSISLRYPTVELASGLFAACCVLKFGIGIESLIYYAFISALITITYIDIDFQIIPDIISLPGIPLFFLASFLVPQVTPLDAFLGLLLGGGTLYLIAWGYHLLAKKEGMGGGDIKLLAMIGSLIGWKGVLFTIFFSSAVGTLSGVILMMQQKKGMKLAIPYGPFLSLGAIAYIFFGAAIIGWYLNVLR